MVEETALVQMPADRPRLPVVGIGASAGGISALQELFANLPPQVGAALVIIVHLDPQHQSELAKIIAAHTALRVFQVNERMLLETDTVYVIPPNRQLLISGQDISTASFQMPRGQRAPIDLFFRSMAEQHGDGFAVILSGGGSDGAVGVRAVKEKGGLILVQDPIEAEYPSMPRSAIASGADFVLPIRELAAKLAELIRTKSNVEPQLLDETDEELLRHILGHLRVKTGQDFSKYKRATVIRRVSRRMQVVQVERLEEYLAYLRDNVEEAQALFNDLLISVTSFFRDPDAFAALAADIIPRLFERKHLTDSLRVWVPGCATGEEAYTIAILLLEEAARRELRPDIQVFASDLDSGALATAREGRYPTAISADVSEDRLRRFFTCEGEHYRIRREVRDIIVFATHSLLKDPPFSRINLISCRNLLIYLDRDLQQQASSIFHYALLPGGFLFLGASEAAEGPPGLFSVVNRDAHIYQANDTPRDALPPLPRGLITVRIPDIPVGIRPLRQRTTIDAAMHRQALEQLAPPSMLVDERHLVVNLSETAGRYLLHPSGPVTTDAAEIVRPELRLELRAALHRAFEHHERTLSLPIPVQFNGSTQSVVIQVRPVIREQEPRTALVIFVEGGATEIRSTRAPVISEPSDLVSQLRDELLATRTLLRTTREQYETATEELRAANEELQSINEEYRSTAEELETSKEELQSINEELQTVNHELKLKLEMVSRAHNDLQNLMSATDVGTLFLDAGLRIQRFTPRVAELFNIVSGDEGRPVTDFTHRLEYHDLVADARHVLHDLVPIEHTVRTSDERWFLMRIRPYRTLEDKIEGVGVTFVDVTERRRAEAAWASRQQMLLGELTHRVKNTLSVVQAITHQTLRGSGAGSETLDTLDARIRSLALAHDLLVRDQWKGANLAMLAREQLASYQQDNSDRVRINGTPIILPPSLATPLALVLHELATNAAKYGALKVPGGRVELEWQTRDSGADASLLEVIWRERGGPEITTPPTPGTGTKLIDNAIRGATVQHTYAVDGLVFTLSIPLRQVATHPQDADRQDNNPQDAGSVT